MFSHVLVAYQSALLEFANKTTETFNGATTALEKEPHYNFTILKELTQGSENVDDLRDDQLAAVDSDQMLFFKVIEMFFFRYMVSLFSLLFSG